MTSKILDYIQLAVGFLVIGIWAEVLRTEDEVLMPVAWIIAGTLVVVLAVSNIRRGRKKWVLQKRPYTREGDWIDSVLLEAKREADSLKRRAEVLMPEFEWRVVKR